MPRPCIRVPHPFKVWKDSAGLTNAEVAQLVMSERDGAPIHEDYIRMIVNGHRRPSWDVAKILSSLTGDTIPPEVFMEYQRNAEAA